MDSITNDNILAFHIEYCMIRKHIKYITLDINPLYDNLHLIEKYKFDMRFMDTLQTHIQVMDINTIDIKTIFIDMIVKYL